MPELAIQITGVDASALGMTPLLHFKLDLKTGHPTDAVEAVLLTAQIQIECPQRAYTGPEKEKLVELFGRPESWGQTLRRRLWTHANTTVGAFTGSTEGILPVLCTYDLNLAAAKYFYGLEAGEIPLLFLFSGSVFYKTQEGRLQVERISWNTECLYRLPVRLWQELMEQHYPQSAWVYLRRDVFDRLYGYKRREGLATWEQVMEQLLDGEPGPEPSHLCEPRSNSAFR
jgi:hypothetical protein